VTTLFDSLKIGNLELANRIIMGPMTRSRANDEGLQAPFAAEYYGQRASAGLIITEATNISPMAKGYVRTPGIYTNEHIESWRAMPDAVHSRGGKIFMQIFHTGRIALPDFLPDRVQPLAPSAVRAKGQNYTDEGVKEFVTPREISKEEIDQTVKDFARAAENAIKAGFDGVELHAASGYIVQQFLTTNANLRVDEYGGSLENRSRFLFEILDAMIAAIGRERVGVKFSPRMPFNDIEEADAEAMYPYIIERMNDPGRLFRRCRFHQGVS
jgi:N-ethylmaleimide reductase